MNQETVSLIANYIFDRVEGTRQEAPDHVMNICLRHGDLQRVIDTGTSDFEARVWFESLESHENGIYKGQVLAALKQPGSCMIKVGERVDEEHVMWRAAGTFLFDG